MSHVPPPHVGPTRGGPPPATRRARLALASWMGVLGLAGLGLVRAGEALPALPDPRRPGATLHWIDQHGALTSAFVVLRAGALVVAAYLTVVTVLGVLARLSRRATLVRLADAVTVARLRHLLRATTAAGALTLPVLAGGGPTAAWAAGDPAPTPPPTIRVLTTEPTTPSTTTSTRLPGIDPPVLRRLPANVSVTDQSDPTAATPVTTTPPAADPTGMIEASRRTAAPDPPGSSTGAALPSPAHPITEPTTTRGPDPIAPRPDAAVATAAPEGTWRIEPGDHLWRVAQQTLRSRTGRPPSDEEITDYVARIVAANRDVLVVPDNPDLVFAGQVFLLPATSG